MGDERWLVRVRTASYAVPGGFPIVVSDVGGCQNGDRDEELIRCVRGADPKVMTELVAAAKTGMAMMGCPAGCGIDKDNSAGILYHAHSQDSSFVTSSAGGMTASSTGTSSLVGERLIEGAQGTRSEDAVLAVGCVSQFSSSWPALSGLSGLRSSENALYKGMTLDRSSDEDYIPSTVVVDDVAMSLGDNKTSEANGLGDSRHASADGSCDGSLDFMDDVEQSAQVVPDAGGTLFDSDRIVRLENGVGEDRDLFDRLRDVVEDMEIEMKSLMAGKKDVESNGCSGCSRYCKSLGPPAIPIVKPSSLVNVTGSATTAGPSRSSPGKVPTSPRKGARKQAASAPEEVTRPVAPAVMAPCPPITILRRPTYAVSDETRVINSFASVAASGASADGYNIVKGCKRFTAKKTTQDPITSIPVRSRHLTVRFNRKRDEKYTLPAGVTVGRIRDTLNKTLFGLNCQAYFSLSLSGKCGDVFLTLATTDVADIVGYYPAMGEALETLGLTDFTFARDTDKVKVFVGMVPLLQFGGGWLPLEWEGSSAFDRMATDIEQSNPGVVVAVRPSWAGRLHQLKERKANNAGLILVLEMSPEVRLMIGASNPKLVVASRPRVCRL